MRLGALVLFAALLLVPATASAATKVSLVRAADGVRLEVRITSKKPFKKATRPTGVKVTAGGATYRLKKVASTRKSSRWQAGPNAALEALGGQKVKLKVSTRRKARTTRPRVPVLPPVAAAPGATTPPIQLTRDDAAGQAALAGAGDLLLEWAEFGASGSTAEYRRIWMLADGTFRRNVIDWNSVSGEICREALTGSWTFKEGYTATYNGGGVVVKVTVTLSNGQAGDDIIAFSNVDTSTVWVGAQLTPYSRNPQIMQNC